MSRWLVTHIPSGLLLVGLIVLIAGGAALIQWCLRRRFPALKGDEHNDGTKFMYGFIGFFYAFFIGFVVNSMWGQNNAADVSARAEGAAAVQMARDAVVFDAPDRDRIRQSLLTYEQAAIAEWPQAENRRSTVAEAALARLNKDYQAAAATTDAQKTLLSTSFSNLDKISQARTVRLLTAREDAGLPWSIWAVIFLTSAMVLGIVILYGVERPDPALPDGVDRRRHRRHQFLPDPPTGTALRRRRLDNLGSAATGGRRVVPARSIAGGTHTFQPEMADRVIKNLPMPSPHTCREPRRQDGP